MAKLAERRPWDPPTFNLRTKEQAHEALNTPNLLDSFFAGLEDMCTLLAASPATSSADLSLAWQMSRLKKVNVLVYGQTGAGKSTLIGELVGKPLGGATTTRVGIEETPCGVCFVDRPGIDIPGAVATHAESKAHDELHAGWYARTMRSARTFFDEQQKQSLWRATLRDLDRRLDSDSAVDRPIALVYVHQAGNRRVHKEHIKLLLSKGHQRLVPTFIVIGNKWSADNASRNVVEAQLTEIIQELGPNARKRLVELRVLSATPYETGGTKHPSTGVGEFISSLLSNLQPHDALTFIKPRRMIGRLVGAGRRGGGGAEGRRDGHDNSRCDEAEDSTGGKAEPKRRKRSRAS